MTKRLKMSNVIGKMISVNFFKIMYVTNEISLLYIFYVGRAIRRGQRVELTCRDFIFFPLFSGTGGGEVS